MASRKIKIAEADYETLSNYCRDTLGIEVKAKTPLPALRAKVSTATGGNTEITIFEGEDISPVIKAAAAQQAEAIIPRANQGKPDPLKYDSDEEPPERVEVQIHVQDRPGGSEPVQIGVNGKLMLVPRNKRVSIPWAYFEVLSKAVETRYDPLPEGGLSEPRYVHRYPYTLFTPLPTALDLKAQTVAA